jgi:hypothetical protein
MSRPSRLLFGQQSFFSFPDHPALLPRPVLSGWFQKNILRSGGLFPKALKSVGDVSGAILGA